VTEARSAEQNLPHAARTFVIASRTELAVMDYADLTDRVQMLSDGLPDDARIQALRVVEVCRALAARPRSGPSLVPSDGDLPLRRELARLVELLGRRLSRALPAAALGRAALADLAGDRAVFQQALRDSDAKLQLWGV
jgi:hypothetical protein